MKQSDIEALLAPAVVRDIAARAEKRGLADPFAIAIGRSGDNVALAAIRVQQLVGLIPTREDADNLKRVAAKEPPRPWVERHPEPAPPAPEEEAAAEPEIIPPAPAAEPAPEPEPAPPAETPEKKPKGRKNTPAAGIPAA